MFNKLTDLSIHRDITGAIGFYLFSIVVLAGVSTVLGHVLGTIGLIEGSVGSFFDGGSVHVLIGSLFTLLLSTLILKSKGLTSDLLSILLVITGVGLAHEVSLLVGLIPVAYLTVLKNSK